MQSEKLEWGSENELRLLSHVLDIDVGKNFKVRVFQDFSCKFTDDPVLFVPWSIVRL